MFLTPQRLFFGGHKLPFAQFLLHGCPPQLYRYHGRVKRPSHKRGFQFPNDGENSAPRVHSQIQLLERTPAGWLLACIAFYTKHTVLLLGKIISPKSKQQQEDRQTDEACGYCFSINDRKKRTAQHNRESYVRNKRDRKRKRRRERKRERGKERELQEELQTINMLILLIFTLF